MNTTSRIIPAAAALVAAIGAVAVATNLASSPAPTDASQTAPLFAIGGPLYCSGIESMPAADAAAALEELGYSVRPIDMRMQDVRPLTTIPADGEVKHISGPDDGEITLVVAPPDSELYGSGYEGHLPPQDCEP